MKATRTGESTAVAVSTGIPTPMIMVEAYSSVVINRTLVGQPGGQPGVVSAVSESPATETLGGVPSITPVATTIHATADHTASPVADTPAEVARLTATETSSPTASASKKRAVESDHSTEAT